MEILGGMTNNFEVPVCNCFHAKVLNNQLCYQVDPNNFSNDIKQELKSGLAFIMDYNEDRQINLDKTNTVDRKVFGMVNSIVASDEDQQAFIYLDTIGKIKH